MAKTTKKVARVARSTVTRRPRATASTVLATSRRPSVFPAHLQTTPDEWRAVKRQEWLDVTHALGRFMYGSAYVPAQAEVWRLHLLAGQITESLDQNDWIAW